MKATMTWWLAVSLFAVQRALYSSGKDIHDIRQLCPYSDYCTRPARIRVIMWGNINAPCCMPCFCSAFCWARGDCCDDVIVPPPPDISAYTSAIECVSNTHSFQDGRWLPKHVNGLNYIYMVAECVGTAKNHPVSERCQVTPGARVTHLIPVWSPTSGDVYRNSFCAMCYDITDFEFFTVNIGILNDYVWNNDEPVNWDVIDYILKQPSSKPHYLQTTPPEAIVNRIPYCNLTSTSANGCHGSVASTDAGFEYSKRQCEDERVTQTYIEANVHPEESQFRVHNYYRNVYCFICHVYTLYNSTDVLLMDLPEVCRTHTGIVYPVSGRNTLPVAFTESIGLFGDAPTVERTICGHAEILDPYMDICRKLVCPDLSLAYNGDCYYTDNDDIARTASFRGYMITGVDQSYYTLEMRSRIIYRKFANFCSDWCIFLCDMEIGVGDSPDETGRWNYFLSVGFQYEQENGITSLTYIQYANEFLSMASKGVVLGYKETVHLLRGVDARQFQYSNNWYFLNRTCSGEFHVVKVWCPTIELSNYDFRYAVAHNILSEAFEFNNPDEVARNQTASRQICTRDYLQAWLTNSRASRIQIFSLWHVFVLTHFIKR